MKQVVLKVILPFKYVDETGNRGTDISDNITITLDNGNYTFTNSKIKLSLYDIEVSLSQYVYDYPVNATNV